MATIKVSFSPLPAHVRTARLIAASAARRSGVAGPVLDELRLAVGEACLHAVQASSQAAQPQPVQLALTSAGGRFEAVVTSVAGPPDGLGIAVISGLADSVEIRQSAGLTSVVMSWQASDQLAAVPGDRAVPSSRVS